MKAKTIYNSIFFGTALQYLRYCDETYAVHGDSGILANIQSVLDSLNEMGLKVTLLSGAVNDLKDITKELKAIPPDQGVSSDQKVKLNHIIGDLRKIIDAETKSLISFVLTEKRLNVDKLLNDIGSLFAENVYDKLPDIAKMDLANAGKCIAFDLPTSAAFHLMRATEAIIRVCYCLHVKRNRIKVLLWGPMIDSLLTKKKKSIAPTLLERLDYIRVAYRNPTQHPEAIYNIDEAQDLFGVCVDVINKLALHLK